MKKRILSLLLVLCMIVALLPVTVSAATPKYYTVEKYDAEGNGTMLVPPTKTENWNGRYGTTFITSLLGSDNVTMSDGVVTGIKAADSTWLNNDGNSKWYIATNYNKEVYLDSSYFYAKDTDVLRFIYVPNGDFSKAGMEAPGDYSDAYMNVEKGDLIKTLSAYNGVALGTNRQAAYDAGIAAIVNINATDADVAAAKTNMENAEDNAGSITLNKETTELYVGQKETLTATLEPEGSTDALTWTSDNENVVKVENGVLKGMSAGTAAVTVEANGLTDSIQVTVKALQGLYITKVNSNASSTIEAKKEELLLTAYAVPDNLENLDWQWSVEDPSIAEVTPTEGNEYLAAVSGKAEGTTNVVVTLGSRTATFEVTVTPYVGPYVYFDYADSSKADQRLDENNTITLSSLDAGSFKVANSNGAVRWNCAGNIPAPTAEYPDALAWHTWINSETGKWIPSGTQPVTANVDTTDGFTATFTINYQVASGITELKNVVNGQEVSAGNPFTMEGTGRAGIVTKGLLNGEWITVPQQALKYTTTDTTGNIRILGNELILGREGEATLTAAMIGESVSASFRAQCGSVPITGFTIKTPETFTITGEKNFMNNQYYGLELYSSNLVITYEPSNTTQKELVWEALTPNIAFYTVEHNAGIVPLRCGTAQFKVTSKSNSELTQTVTVKFLYQNPLTNVSLEKTEYTLEVGKTEALSFTFTPENATDKALTYSYDKAGIVEVKDGKIIARSAGTVTVTATPSDQTSGAQPVTFTVTVPDPDSGDDEGTKETVDLKVGQSKAYTDETGDYTKADLSGLDTSVATVTLEAQGVGGAVTEANLGTTSSFNASAVDISKCLYNFEKNSGGTWTITGTDASGNTVYLYPGNGKDVANGDRTAGYPNAAADNPQLDDMTITISQGNEDGSFYIWSNENAWQDDSGAYLYFNRMAYNWNRSQTISKDTEKAYCSMFLYRAAGEGETSSEAIPGYVRVTSVDALTDGQYLIAAPGSNGKWYVAYPSASTASLYSQIGQVSTRTAGNATKITIKGVGVGETSVKVGDIQYVTFDALAIAKDDIAHGLEYLKGQSMSEFKNEWTIFTTLRAGGTVTAENQAAYIAAIKAKLDSGAELKVTEYDRLILTLGVMGKDPTNFGGHNLINKLCNHSSSLTEEYSTVLAFALMALDSRNYTVPAGAKFTREAIIAEMLDRQVTTGDNAGAFDLYSGGTDGGVDATGMVLQSLAPYNNASYPAVQTAFANAQVYLKKVMTSNAGYVVGNGEISCTTAQVVVALCAAGIDPLDSANGYTVGTANLITNLHQFRKDSGFALYPTGVDADVMSTQQTTYALEAYRRFAEGANRLYDLSDVELVASVAEDAEITVTIANAGTLVMAQKTVTVTDRNEDGTLDVDEALYAAHEAGFEGGASAGYLADPSGMVTKLWGVDTTGTGYWLNDASCSGVADAVTAGDNLVAWIYKDTTSWSDAYVKWGSTSASATTGTALTVSLQKAGYDSGWNMVFSALTGATFKAYNADLVEVNVCTAVDNEDGTYGVTFTTAGEYYLVATGNEDTILVPTVCKVTVAQGEETTTPGDVNGDGRINGLDILRVYNYSINTSTTTEDQLKQADMNNDGRINGLDILAVYKLTINAA